MIELSKFYSEDKQKIATVYREDVNFFTSVRSKTGIWYTSKFETEEHAENYAEEWVLKNE